MSDPGLSPPAASEHPPSAGSPTRRRPVALPFKLLLLLGSLLIAIGFAEVAARLLRRGPLGTLFYEDSERRAVDINNAPAEAVKRGLIEFLPPELTPRRRGRFAPGAHFYMCYQDRQVLHRDWLDDHGCVEVQINQWGIREREEIGPDKPAGERRVVCIGDSFTFGWGIPVELGWVRLLENELRKDGKQVRTVNCGASGALLVDEYWCGLEKRFYKFQPDAVVMTLCLNDLLPSNGLCLIIPPKETGFRLFDLARNIGHDPLALDPNVDWVGILMQLPREQAQSSGMNNGDAPYDAMWAQGAPQAALRATRDWCRARHLPFMVTLWPFLQGLGEGRFYPFRPIHELVAQFCMDEDIPFLDLLPSLLSRRAEELWVTPADMHPNPLAQRLVLPAITDFVKSHCGF